MIDAGYCYKRSDRSGSGSSKMWPGITDAGTPDRLPWQLRAWRKVMTAYRRDYDSRHLQADCQEPGSALEPYARQSSMGYLF